MQPFMKPAFCVQFPSTAVLLLMTGDFVRVVGFQRKISIAPPTVAWPTITSQPPGVISVSSIMFTMPPAYSVNVWFTAQLTVVPGELLDTVHFLTVLSPGTFQNTMSFVRSHTLSP